MKSKTVIMLILAVPVIFGIFLFLRISLFHESQQDDDVILEKVNAVTETRENYSETKIEDLYPDLEFGDWVTIPKKDLNFQDEIKYNGTLIEEYTNENIYTQIRVHNQKQIFYDFDSFIKRNNYDEKSVWVYDNPEERNYLFSLQKNKSFDISLMRRDFNLDTNETFYWLYVKFEGMEGWTLMEKTSSPLNYFYEDDYWVPKAVYFPFDPYHKIYHIRKVSGGCWLYNSLTIYSQPLYRQSNTEIIYDPNDDYDCNISISFLYTTAEEDLNNNDKLWYYVQNEEKKGWTSDDTNFDSGRGGVLIKNPSYVVSDYYGSGC